MALSTFSSEWGSEPRVVPPQRWPFAAMLALTLFALALCRWEWQMRALGLRTADIDDGKSAWVVERRKVDVDPRNSVVLVGDSRNLVDNNLDVWEQLTGFRPLQLSIAGLSPLPVLQDLADDPEFAGLVVLGGGEFNLVAQPGTLFGNAAVGRSYKVRDYLYTQSPSQRSGHQLQRWLSQSFAFLDSSYTLFNLLGDLPLRDRPGVERFLFAGGGSWKLAETHTDRQTRLWRRVECDRNLQQAFRAVWSGLNAAPVADQPVSAAIVTLSPLINRIRQRGGEVVLLRPPSAGRVLDLERRVVPRERVWNRLVRETRSFGIHFEDYDDMQGLSVPDWSHLSGSSARLFTQAYVNVLCQQVYWLKTRSLPSCYGAPRIVANVGNHHGTQGATHVYQD
jgi:hypothetical protein